MRFCLHSSFLTRKHEEEFDAAIQLLIILIIRSAVAGGVQEGAHIVSAAVKAPQDTFLIGCFDEFIRRTAHEGGRGFS